MEKESENNEKKVENNNMKIISGIVSVVIVIFSAYFYFGGGVEQSVAQDSIEQYEMCIRNNDHIGASVQAGVAAAAFMQAGDDAGYRKWNAIEKEEMDKATKETMNDYGM